MDIQATWSPKIVRLTFAIAVTAAAMLFFVAGARPAAGTVPFASDSVTFAFVNAAVIPMDRERILERHTVLVRSGRIVEVGPSSQVEVPLGAVVLDVDGKYLLPGLAEMHAHLLGTNASEQAVRDILFLYVANGVLNVRGMLGAPNQLTLRDAVARGRILGPTIIVGAPSLNGQSAPTPAIADSLVREHKTAGYDFLKLHPGLTRQVYDAIVAAARGVGLTFAGHVSAGVGLQRTLEARQSTIDHLDGYLEAAVSPVMHARMAVGPVPFGEMVAAVEPARLRAWAGRTREAGTWNVPTMFLWESFYSPESPEVMAQRPEMRYASAQMVNAWSQQKRGMSTAQSNQGVRPEHARRYLELRRLALRALADSGAPLLMGTDSPQMFNVPGFSLRNEIALLQSAGLTPYQILESGTRNVARYVSQDLKGDGSFGTITVGNRADLILLDANPLLDARNSAHIAGVMLRGRWIPMSEIQRGLDELSRRYRPAM